MPPSYILGVDGGGTKSDFVACDLSGRILGRTTLGASTLQNVGGTQCEAILREGWESLQEEAGLSTAQLAGACLGVAGLDTPTDRREYQAIIQRIFREYTSLVRLESDCYIAIHCGTLGRPGIAVIAGTGSMAIGENERGQQYRSGGWGYLFGDEGSAYEMGRQAVIAALKAFDGRGPQTQLSNLIEQVFGSDLETLVADLYRSGEVPQAVAALAQLVDHAASNGDRVALKILEESAMELATAANAVQARLHLQIDPIPVVLSGGAMKSDLLRRLLRKRLSSALEKCEYIQPQLPPVAGACIVALKGTGTTISDEIVGALQSGLT